MATPKKYDHIDFVPPKGAAEAAELGLRLREEFGRGGTEVGVARARDLKNRETLSPETIRRMVSFFARHAVNADAAGSESDGFWGDNSNPSAGWVAWLLWGGDPGRTWAEKVDRQMDSADEEEKEKDFDVVASEDMLGDGASVVKFCGALHDAGYVFQKGDRISRESNDVVTSICSLKKELGYLASDICELVEEMDNVVVSDLPEDECYSIEKSMKILKAADLPEEIEGLKEKCNSVSKRIHGATSEVDVPSSVEKGISSVFKNFYKSEQFVSIEKGQKEKEEEEHFVLGVVLEPNDGSDGHPEKPDTDGDIYSAEEVRKACHWFMEFGRKSGLLHGPKRGGEILEEGDTRIVILENYILPVDIPEGALGEGSLPLKAGTWMMGARINDTEIWEDIKNGELDGFSIGGVARELDPS